jgi:protein-S-isoprenylcysteine O-methyltransferase Ste14
MFNSLIGICWLIFIGVWVAYSLEAKKNIQANGRKRYSFVRLVMITSIIILVFTIKNFRGLANYHLLPVNNFMQTMGVLICAAGIAFAVWARMHIGKNWGMPMSLKEKPDLIMTGPYSFIRHPIYTGLLMAMFGSMVTAGFTWLIWLILFIPYFVYSAKKEEKVLLVQFPQEYADYMKRTKMLIPFIF